MSLLVSAGGGSGFGAEAYTQLKRVALDSRMRLLAFYEDTRPAYL